MSTYHYEQYYVYVKTTGATKETLETVRVLLVENDWDDHEFSVDELVIDGFESEDDANTCDEIVREYLSYD